jgi:hypothetical protein
MAVSLRSLLSLALAVVARSSMMMGQYGMMFQQSSMLEMQSLTYLIHSNGLAKNDLQVVQKPKVDCAWFDWEEWGDCSEACDGGYQIRDRSVARRAEFGGAGCPNEAVGSRRCNTEPCKAGPPPKPLPYGALVDSAGVNSAFQELNFSTGIRLTTATTTTTTTSTTTRTTTSTTTASTTTVQFFNFSNFSNLSNFTIFARRVNTTTIPATTAAPTTTASPTTAAPVTTQAATTKPPTAAAKVVATTAATTTVRKLQATVAADKQQSGSPPTAAFNMIGLLVAAYLIL